MNKNEKPARRGLEAMLGNIEIPVRKENTQVVSGNTNIHIDSIEANPYQPRTQFDQAALEELAQSIKTYGLIQPVTVRPVGNGKYQLISGERRFRAAQLAGLTEIPAFVRTVDDALSIQMALVENIQRADLNAIEIAMSYQMLIDECHLTQEELGAKVGKTNTTISNYLRLCVTGRSLWVTPAPSCPWKTKLCRPSLCARSWTSSFLCGRLRRWSRRPSKARATRNRR